jgi:hypothetical protein
MIFIDNDEWPPSMHGTGSEDYFNHAWGMQKNAFPFNGTIVHETDVPGYQVSYRFHIADPIHFSRHIRVTMEHGHANHLSDDWASTAYWYQTLPTKPFDILPVADRLPTHIVTPTGMKRDLPEPALTDEQRKRLDEAQARGKQYVEERQREVTAKLERTRQQSAANIEQARRIRASFK